MEKQLKIEGKLAPCPGPNCATESEPHGGQPKFYENSGNNKVHAACHKCKVRLWDCNSLQEAISVWEALPRPEIVEEVALVEEPEQVAA